MTSRFRLPRRMFLRGMGGFGVAQLALPPLEAMLNTHGTAYADGTALPNRFGIFFWGSGNRPDRWAPKTTGADYQMTDELAPLAKVKSQLAVISGTNFPFGRGTGHHTHVAGYFSGSYYQDTGTNGTTLTAPTVDVLAAQQMGGNTPHRALRVGVDALRYADEGTTGKVLSHNGPGDVNEPDLDPVAFFDRLFPTAGGGGTGAPAPDVTKEKLRAKARRSVLDAITKDAVALQSRVGSADRKRIDQHLTSIREVEMRIKDPEAPPVFTGQPPPRPSGSVTDGKRDHKGVSRAFSDILTVALATDMTRVFLFQFGMWHTQTFWQAPVSDDFHVLSHDMAAFDQVHQGVVFFMTELAYLLDRLQSTPMGAGTLLDQCGILATSEMSDGFSHSGADMPVIVAGKANGALKTGFHSRMPDGTHTNQVMFTMLRKVAGLNLSSWGTEEFMVKQGIAPLEA